MKSFLRRFLAFFIIALLAFSTVLPIPAASQTIGDHDTTANGHIAYVKPSPSDSAKYAIYTYDPDTRAERLLVDGTANINDLEWSPDGEQLAFTNVTTLEIIDADGTDRQQLNDESFPIQTFTWSPDGQQMVAIHQPTSALYLIDLQLYEAALLWDIDAYTSLSWSPATNHLVFYGFVPSYNYGIYSIDMNTGDTNQLTSGMHSAFPQISPDGSKILYSASYNNYTSIYQMNADGSGQEVVRDKDGVPIVAFWYDWSPDSKQIVYFAPNMATPSIYILNAFGERQLVAANASYSTRVAWQTKVAGSPTPWPANAPLYRLANWKTAERLFTTNYQEVLKAQENNSGWVYENVAMQVYTEAGSNRTAVYRMANWKSKERLFTTNYAEVQYALQHYAGWVYEGIAFYASTDATNTPVYRMANWKTAERLFTTDANERDAIRDKNGWVYEGVAFYAAQ